MTQREILNGVIVAENDALMRGIIRSVLVEAGHQVFPVADGLEAVTLARQFKARLVLLDIGMRRLNGLQACEAIRALPDYADVPIVMLTGYHDERLSLAAQRLGANDFITKPFQPGALLARLAVFLDVHLNGIRAGASTNTNVQTPQAGRAQVWDIHHDPVPACADSDHSTEGLTMLRIFRSAERNG